MAGCACSIIGAVNNAFFFFCRQGKFHSSLVFMRSVMCVKTAGSRLLVSGSPSILLRLCPRHTWHTSWRPQIAGGTVDFNRQWEDYEDGFGQLSGEFWYGLKNMHCLTTRQEVELRIDLRGAITWVYKTFRVDGSDDKYRLHIGEGEGPGFDHMEYHNNYQFSTPDEDNDASGNNCASNLSAGWWYRSCQHALLTGPHVASSTGSRLQWGRYYPNVEMKVRPKSCLTG